MPTDTTMSTYFIMLDGLRPDAISADATPTLQSLAARGASTFRARSVMPSITLPCHMSIFHSVPPQRHGITDNVYVPMARPGPGLVESAARAGKRCAFFYNWEELRDLARPGNLSHAFFVNASHLFDGDDIVADEAARALSRRDLDFAFVYFGTIDTAGHAFGWMSEMYLQQAQRVDGLVARVLDAAGPDATILAHADHGGHERTHGTDADDDMLIPWIAAGPGIRRGHAIAAPVNLMDTAPTLAHMLGVPTPHGWEGRVVQEIFHDAGTM